ncbi:MAG: UDP-N-acetylmuramoyl-tripeptide--D-alanyl-D-alanine ligase [Lachnospiraceae bacterium]|jgi:UDP-N-acetylmuramoyl-tripeptide--D-alanyl-D-alanine ligase
MKGLTPSAIAECCGGKLYCGDEIKNVEISGASADSRAIGCGYMFIPVKGNRVDGHDFIPQVFEKGAMITLTEKKDVREKYPCILVESTLEAIKAIAAFYIRQLDIKVVAITGSVGKTSTKEFAAAVFSGRFKTKKTIKNLNNAIGLPYSIFTLEEDDEIAVLEMGINHFGEMRELSKIAPPDIAIITNIGTCHLEFLGDRDGVLKAKTEMFENLKENGTVILNGDDDKLRKIEEVNGIKPVFVGLDPSSDVYADNIVSRGLLGMKCDVHYKDMVFELEISKPGIHMVTNALEAVAAALSVGMTPEEIKEGLGSCKGIEGRLNIIKTDSVTVIDDCYNANPMSMKASCEVLSRAEGRKVAVLGDMGELGDDSELLHREVGKAICSMNIDVVAAVGEKAGLIAEEVSENPEITVFRMKDADDFIEKKNSVIVDGDTVLIKASHSMNFDKIVKALTD